MSRPAPRSFRPVSDDLWHAVVAKAHSRGTTASAVINEALLRYVEGERRPAPRRDIRREPHEGQEQGREDGRQS